MASKGKKMTNKWQLNGKQMAKMAKQWRKIGGKIAKKRQNVNSFSVFESRPKIKRIMIHISRPHLLSGILSNLKLFASPRIRPNDQLRRIRELCTSKFEYLPIHNFVNVHECVYIFLILVFRDANILQVMLRGPRV